MVAGRVDFLDRLWPPNGHLNFSAFHGDEEHDVKLASTFLVATGILGMLAASSLRQGPSSASSAKRVSLTTRAANYRHRGPAQVEFQRTELMQQASGEARLQDTDSR